MLYISKGVVCKGSAIENLHIARGNTKFTLTGTEAQIWLDGRFQMVSFHDNNEREAIVKQLADKGLAEYEPLTDALAQYRILSRCICCPAKNGIYKKLISKQEKVIWKWLSNAGLRLSTAELMFLIEHNIPPSSALFGTENRQALIETIYTKDTIFDNILETQMEHMACRNEVITALLKLLNKKRIILL